MLKKIKIISAFLYLCLLSNDSFAKKGLLSNLLDSEFSVDKEHRLKLTIANDLKIEVKVLKKETVIASCFYTSMAAHDKRRSKVESISFDLIRDKCEYISDKAKEKFNLIERSYLVLNISGEEYVAAGYLGVYMKDTLPSVSIEGSPNKLAKMIPQFNLLSTQK